MSRSAKIDQVLSLDSSLQPLLAKMREIRSLNDHCNEFLPAELARRVRASNLRDGRLVLLAANAAAAAKLRLLAPSLSEFLSRQGAKVNAVSVRVQPREINEAAREAPTPRSLSEVGFATLSALYESLRDSPARDAVKAFLDHEQRSAGRRRSGRKTREETAT